MGLGICKAAEYVHLYCLLALFFCRIAAAATVLSRPKSDHEAEQLWGYAAWAAFLHGRTGEAKAPVIVTAQNVAAFYQFFSMLCRYWFQGDIPKEKKDQLKALGQLAGENGYSWLQAEAVLLLVRPRREQ